MKLEHPYREEYQKVVLLLEKKLPVNVSREKLLRDIYEIYSDAQKQQTPLSELYPDGFEVFYREILESLPVYTMQRQAERQKPANLLLRVLWIVAVGALLYWLICR